MKALTLHRPWSDAIAYWPGRHAKRVENRGWWPRAALGKDIAIHAGRKYDREGSAFIRELAEEAASTNGGWRVPGASESHEGVVCVVRFCGVIDEGPDGAPRLIAGERGDDGFSWEAWWMGGIGLLLDRVRPIEAVPCRGAQGLWDLPAAVERVVCERVRASRQP